MARRRRPRYVKPNAEKKHRLNDQIRAREVRLVDAAGTQVGVVPLPRARAAAADAGLDLVEVAPDARPPVVKVLDYGRYEYEQSVKEREARRNRSSSGGLKEMKYRPRIGDADFDTKTRKVRQFLDGGDRVKITVQLRGRERSRPSLASDMVHRVVDELDGEASLLHEPKGEGRSFSAVLEPAG